MEISQSSDPAADAARRERVACVRRLLANARRMQHSGVWLSVEEIEAALHAAPRCECACHAARSSAARRAQSIWYFVAKACLPIW